MDNTHMKNVVVIGGGTGSFGVLSGLKDMPQIRVTALVSMADDGGSTGLLRDELGVLPPGDIRQCLVALSNSSQELRDLFNFRFQEGTLGGHTFGNIFLSTVEKMTNDFASAVRIAGHILNINGQVVPITLDNIRLSVSWKDGTTIRGQAQIAAAQFAKEKGEPYLTLEPRPTINPEATKAIAEADLVVVAPGDLYGSLAPPLIVPGVREALKATKAKKVYVCNLVTKLGHTEGFTVEKYVAEIERFIGDPSLDYVLYNTARPSPEILERYLRKGELLIEPGEGVATHHYQAIAGNFLNKHITEPPQGDSLAWRRSYIRHDPRTVAEAIMLLVKA